MDLKTVYPGPFKNYIYRLTVKYSVWTTLILPGPWSGHSKMFIHNWMVYFHKTTDYYTISE